MNAPHVYKRLIIFFNDKPHQILPATWTKEQAQIRCNSLNEPFKGQVFDEPYWITAVPVSGEYLRSPHE